MIRADMITTVGRTYLTSNIENDEYSYPKAFSAASLTFVPIRNSAGRAFEKLDIRFVKDNITVLIETKPNFTKSDEEQLSAYVEYEKALTGNKTIAILANTVNNNIKVWRGVVSDGDYMPKETALRSMDEYVDFYTSKINDKEKVMQNTYKLNELLHRHSVPEKLRIFFIALTQKENHPIGWFFFLRFGAGVAPSTTDGGGRGLGARPPPWADEGSATREKTRSIGSEDR